MLWPPPAEEGSQSCCVALLGGPYHTSSHHCPYAPPGGPLTLDTTAYSSWAPVPVSTVETPLVGVAGQAVSLGGSAVGLAPMASHSALGN